MTVKEIKSKTEFDELVTSGKTIFVDFYADWCGPCKMISPIFERLAGEHTQEGTVGFYKVNVDDVSDLAEAVGIQSMPTFKAYKDGSQLGTILGADPRALQNLIQTNLA